MIKANGLDNEILKKFIKANGIEPNWMQMQLPLGMINLLPIPLEGVNILQAET